MAVLPREISKQEIKERRMRPRLDSCCFGCTTLRAGCIIIAWFTMIISLLYLINVFLDLNRIKNGRGDETREWILEYGTTVSLTTTFLYILSGIIILVAVFKNIACFLAIAVIMYVFITLGYLGLAGWTLAQESVSLFINFLLWIVFSVYSTLVLYSYYADMRETESRRPEETDDNTQPT